MQPRNAFVLAFIIALINVRLALSATPQETRIFDTLDMKEITKAVDAIPKWTSKDEGPMGRMLLGAERNSAKLDGSANANNQIPAGTIVVYMTDEGHYGKLQILDCSSTLKIRWITYKANGSVASRGDNLAIRSSFLCDLDNGVEGGKANSISKADFMWNSVDGTVRYLLFLNKARFAVYSGH